MTCPCCQAQNSATSVRCYQCGTTLIHEALGHSDGAKQAIRYLDNNIYPKLGAGVGMVMALLAGLITSSSDQALAFLLGIGVVAGAVFGKFIAWKKSKYLW